MGVRYENQCVGCPPDMGCMGGSCLNRNVAIYTCDRCHEDIDGDIYEADGEELCEDCLHTKFRKRH